MRMKKFMILIFSMLLVFYPAFTDVSPPGDNDFNIEQSLFNSDVAVAEINAIDNDVGISVTTYTYINSIPNDFDQLQGINSYSALYGTSEHNAKTDTRKNEGRLTQNIGKVISSNLIWSNEIYHEPER